MPDRPHHDSGPRPHADSQPTGFGLRLVACVDLGSSHIKCMVADRDHPTHLQTVASLPTPVTSSQNESTFCQQAMETALDQIMGQLADHLHGQGASLTDLCITGQVGGVMCLDGQDRLVAPCPTVADRQALDHAQAFHEAFDNDLTAQLGHALPPAGCWSAPKLRRLLGQPGLGDATFMQAPDWVFLRLTGQRWSVANLAISLAHQPTASYAPAVLQWIGLAQSQLPTLQAQGCRHPLTARWRRNGIMDDVTVHLCGGDMVCGLLGMQGALGQPLLQCGTTEIAGAVVSVDHLPCQEDALIRLPLDPHTALLYGSTNNGGLSLSWLRNLVGAALDDGRLWQHVADMAPRDDRPLFVPHLAGARAPHWQPQAKSMLVDLDADHGAADLLYAVLEGCAMSKRAVLEAANLDGQPVRVAGGGARQAAANQIRAQALGRSVEVCAIHDVTAAGACGIALGDGWLTALHQAAGHVSLHPTADARDVCERRYARFQKWEAQLFQSPRLNPLTAEKQYV